jgi:hypothetical protein
MCFLFMAEGRDRLRLIRIAPCVSSSGHLYWHLPDEGAEDAVDIYGEYPGDGIWRGHDSPLGPHHVHATLEMPRCLSFFLYKETG